MGCLRSAADGLGTFLGTSEAPSTLHPANDGTEVVDAEGFEPTTSAPGAQAAIAFFRCFPVFRDSVECVAARESVRFCALTGLVIPPPNIQLAWDSLADPTATDREVALTRWVLLFTLRESREGCVRLNLNHEVALDRRADLAFPRMRGPFKRRNDDLQELRILSSPLGA